MWPLTPGESEALWLSVKVSLWGVGLSLPVGILLALLLARIEFWGKSLVNGVVYLPLVLPPVVTGYFLLLLLGRRGVIGAWLYDALGVTLAFRWTGAAVASAVMGFPLLVRAVRLSFESADRRLEAAAATLGAAPGWVFLTVTLPLAVPGILAGFFLSFGRSLGEFGATITFVSNIPGETQTLPLAIYTYTQVPGGDAAALRLAVISVALSLVALVASELLARQATRRITGI
ncbi:MAG: molybdate ABC transporter permease subunit [Dongiaceae bacterium]